jgi:hypothetical protein
MRSQPDRDGSTDGRDDLDDGRVKAMGAATTSSIPSSVISGSRSGTGPDPHHRSRPSLFQGTRSSSDDKLSDDLLHSPIPIFQFLSLILISILNLDSRPHSQSVPFSRDFRPKVEIN